MKHVAILYSSWKYFRKHTSAMCIWKINLLVSRCCSFSKEETVNVIYICLLSFCIIIGCTLHFLLEITTWERNVVIVNNSSLLVKSSIFIKDEKWVLFFTAHLNKHPRDCWHQRICSYYYTSVKSHHRRFSDEQIRIRFIET